MAQLHFCSKAAIERKDETLENCTSVDTTSSESMLNFIQNPIFQLGLYAKVDNSIYDCVSVGELSTCTISNPSPGITSFNKLPEHTDTNLFLKFGAPVPKSECLNTCEYGLVVEGSSMIDSSGNEDEKCYCVDNAHRKVIDLIGPSCTNTTFGGCLQIINNN